MGMYYYAVNIYGKIIKDKRWDKLDEEYGDSGFDIVYLGYDDDEGTLVGISGNRVGQCEYEEFKAISNEEKAKVDNALGDGCRHYIVQEIN
jgi:hypothetical protein